MSPSTHFIASWLVAAVTTDNARDRKLATTAGVLPDVDGLGILADIVNGMASGHEIHFHYYQKYHHYLTHGWPAALLISVLLAFFARSHWRVMLLCLITFHLHLLCDLVGSRGPGPEDFWPILYSEPLFRHPIWIWRGQWQLDGWQNQILFAVIFIFALFMVVKNKYSFLEFFGQRVDGTFVRILRKIANKLGWFP